MILPNPFWFDRVYKVHIPGINKATQEGVSVKLSTHMVHRGSITNSLSNGMNPYNIVASKSASKKPVI